MNIDAIRSRIPATRTMTYLNTGWAGPMPTPVVESIKARLEYESENGPTSVEVRDSGKEIARQSKEAVAALLNATPEEILLTQNTTEGLGIVTNGLTWSEGDEIITFGLEHAAALFASYRIQQRWGTVVKRLDIETDHSDDGILEKVEEAITDRTRAVILSHIQYSCGLRMPIKEIAKLVRPKSILTLVDGAQTAGHIAIDVRDLDCDVYSIPGQKWLLGPDGTGALYIRRSLIPEIEPKRVSFTDIEQIAPHYTDIKTGDIEVLQGSTASTPLRTGFLEALRFVQAVGIEQIEARSLTLAASLKDRLADIPGVTVTSHMDGPQCSGLVTFTIDGTDPKEVVSAMWRNDRILVRDVSYPGCIRASVDFFNTEDEIARLAVVVRAAAEAAS